MSSLSYMREALDSLVQGQLPVSEDRLDTLFQIYERLRAFCFLIAEGCRPGGKGRGSVLRHLFRSALAGASALEGNAHERIETTLGSVLAREKEVFGRAVQVHSASIHKVVARELELASKTSRLAHA